MALDDPRAVWALGISFALHAAFGVVVAWAFARMPAPSTTWTPPADVWAGETLDMTVLVPVALEAHPTTPGGAAVGNESGEASAPPSPPEPPPATNAAPKPAPAAALPDEAEPAPVEYPSDSWLGVPGELADRDPEPEREPAAGDSERDPLVDRLLAYRPAREREVDPPAAAPPEDAREPSPGAPVGGVDGANGPRDLPRAFTRAIPAANTKDPAWSRLPVGDAGKAWVRITVAEDGAIAEVEPRRPIEPHLERLIRRTALALESGVFALSSTSDGEVSLELGVVISERPRSSGPLALGFEPPRPERPGRAYFQLESGRFVEVFVSVESP